MRPFSKLLLLGLLLGNTLEVCGTAHTGPENPAATDFAALTGSNATLFRALAAPAAESPADTLSARREERPSSLPKLSGYLQAGFDGGGGSSSFTLRRACLYLTGAFTRTLRYHFQFDFARPEILDAFLTYRPFRQLGLKAGEYKVPFSIENTVYSPIRFEFIDYPLALTRLMGLNDLCGLRATGRDMGFSLFGGFFPREGRNLLDYEIGVFNGEGINTRDRNRTKDLAGQLTLQPLSGLRISGSWYAGEYGPEYLRRVRYGAGVCYDLRPVVLRSEWIGGETGFPASGEYPQGRTLTSRGWYVMGGWWLLERLMPVFRYDTFLEESTRSSTRQINCTAGAVWEPHRHLRCQINYTYEHYAARDRANRNRVSIQFSGIF